MLKRPYFPIIYVRGYAGSQGAVEDTVATPYQGFNLGSTKYRQAYRKKDVESWVFESPLIRLMKDHGYVDAYRGGNFLPEGPVPGRSIWIFRYYDITSEELGQGKRQEIEFHALRLRDFILHVRKSVLAHEKGSRSSFRVYLVAHSMGGLICRCYLQNSSIPDLDGKRRVRGANRGVDKLFTYATPHGGIEFRKGLGWLEGLRDFFDINNSDNFGGQRMREFLKLDPTADLRSVEGRFPTGRIFSLVGTDSRDYGAGGGMSRRSVGPMSDGLVQIRNAYVTDSPRAFVHRSHSGHYGIVNSEEGYQNLQRFLFGQIKADLLVDKVKVALPVDLRGKRKISASYFVETVVSIRGIPVEIHRRTIDTAAATYRQPSDLESKPTYLHTLFLDRTQQVVAGRTVSFMARVRVVPQYYVDRKWRRDEHYEGASIFDDGLVFFVTWQKSGPSRVSYAFTSTGLENRETLSLAPSGGPGSGILTGRFGFSAPLISGEFVVRVEPWNDWQ